VRLHYYQPIVAAESLPSETWLPREDLTGVNLRVEKQLALLESLAPFAQEAAALPRRRQTGTRTQFSYDNPSFKSGDAEALYSLVRLTKPRRVLEVGSGYSTLLVSEALARNAAEGAPCEHVCIEPYEIDWLESVPGVTVIRSEVQGVGLEAFSQLEEGDLLFIDSSHVVRTGGDVNFLYLDVLPRLASGVLVHAHDIFLPSEYPREWLLDHFFWTEQYLLHALLCLSRGFEVTLALNYLSEQHHPALAACFPVYNEEPGRRPGSFWFRRV
jgi:predicted O-methyltransferase YrrM